MIGLDDFRLDLIQRSRISTRIEGVGDTAAFISQIMDVYGNLGLMQDYTPCFYSRMVKNAEVHIDGYSYEETEECLCLIIGIYNGETSTPTLTQTEIKRSIERASRFVSNSLSSDSMGFRTQFLDVGTAPHDLYTLIRELKKQNTIQKLKFVIISDAKLSERIKTLSLEDVCGIPTDFEIIDITTIYKILIQDLFSGDLDIDFADFPGGKDGLQCIEIPQRTSLFKCYLAVIPGLLLASLYRKYGSKLLEGNVRSFLTTKKAVNKSIRGTILNAPEKFFVFNNGIAVTATDVTVEDISLLVLDHTGKSVNKKKNLTVIRKISNMQIINGGQTTASLASALHKDKADLSKIAVQMKLTVIEAENKEENNDLIQKISRSSNSQNPVSNADFFSNHAFQQHIQNLSTKSECEAPKTGDHVYTTTWFYERSNGEYAQKKMFSTLGEAKKFEERNPRNQVITKTSLAKAHNLYISRRPDLVSKGAMTNFMSFADYVTKEWDNEDSQKADRFKAKFNSDYYRQIASIHILIDRIGKIVSTQSWYDGSYRANIVAYSIAWFFEILATKSSSYVFDYHLIWDKQDIPDGMKRDFEILTELVHTYITTENKVGNVTQWCKRLDCWNGLKSKPIPVGIDFNKYLRTKNSAADETLQARKDIKVDMEIDSMTIACSKPPQKWLELSSCVEKNPNTFSYADLQAINAVYKMVSGKGSNANKWQCDLAVKAMRKAIDQGYLRD